MPPKVEIEGCEFHENDYRWGNATWKVATLLKAVKDQGCDEFDLPLSGIQLNVKTFRLDDVDDFIFHANRVLNVDMSYPIILNWVGFVCDGWHRIAYAILTGQETIRAVRLKEFVEPDFKEAKEEEK